MKRNPRKPDLAYTRDWPIICFTALESDGRILEAAAVGVWLHWSCSNTCFNTSRYLTLSRASLYASLILHVHIKWTVNMYVLHSFMHVCMQTTYTYVPIPHQCGLFFIIFFWLQLTGNQLLSISSAASISRPRGL